MSGSGGGVGACIGPEGQVATRRRLADRRVARTLDVTWTEPNGVEHDMTVSLGFFDPLVCAEPGEVFARHKLRHTPLDYAVHDAAVLLSMLRQFGVPFRVIAQSLGRQADGSSVSPLGVLARIAAEIEAGADSLAALPDVRERG